MSAITRDGRVGRFSICMDLIEHALGEDAAASALLDLMGRCLVLRAEASYGEGIIEYFAWCPEFDRVDEGAMAPEYIWNVTLKDGVQAAVWPTRVIHGRIDALPDPGGGRVDGENIGDC